MALIKHKVILCLMEMPDLYKPLPDHEERQTQSTISARISAEAHLSYISRENTLQVEIVTLQSSGRILQPHHSCPPHSLPSLLDFFCEARAVCGREHGMTRATLVDNDAGLPVCVCVCANAVPRRCLHHARQLTKETALGLLLTNRNSSTFNQRHPVHGGTREACATAAGFIFNQLPWNFILPLHVI